MYFWNPSPLSGSNNQPRLSWSTGHLPLEGKTVVRVTDSASTDDYEMAEFALEDSDVSDDGSDLSDDDTRDLESRDSSSYIPLLSGSHSVQRPRKGRSVCLYFHITCEGFLNLPWPSGRVLAITLAVFVHLATFIGAIACGVMTDGQFSSSHSHMGLWDNGMARCTPRMLTGSIFTALFAAGVFIELALILAYHHGKMYGRDVSASREVFTALLGVVLVFWVALWTWVPLHVCGCLL